MISANREISLQNVSKESIRAFSGSVQCTVEVTGKLNFIDGQSGMKTINLLVY